MKPILLPNLVTESHTSGGYLDQIKPLEVIWSNLLLKQDHPELPRTSFLISQRHCSKLIFLSCCATSLSPLSGKHIYIYYIYLSLCHTRLNSYSLHNLRSASPGVTSPCPAWPYLQPARMHLRAGSCFFFHLLPYRRCLGCSPCCP